uniref:Uncharacterized protein n=1 Tax=Triticum urartu TaxID=4572 RepID=A0A8R7R3V2_TRIUA
SQWVGGPELWVQEPADLFVVGVQRPSGIVPDAPHGRGAERLVLEPVEAEYLVVGEVERALHALTARHGIIGRARLPARLAPDEVRHQRPPVVAEPRLPLAPHLLVPPHDLLPEPVQVVGALQKHLVPPPAALRHQQVHQRRLVVGLPGRSVRQRRREDPPVPLAHGAARPHARPGLQEVQRPPAVPEQEAAGVGAEPVPGAVHLAVPAVEHQVVARVPAPRRLEQHVREHRVRVHPPQQLRLRVRHHQRAQQRQLGPEPRHLAVQHRVAVEDVQSVHAAVVRLVLERAEEHVVALRLLALARRRAGDHEHPRPPRGDKGRESRVRGQPRRSAGVVVGHVRAQRVRPVAQLAQRLLLLLAGNSLHHHGLRRLLRIRGRSVTGAIEAGVLDADAREFGREQEERA